MSTRLYIGNLDFSLSEHSLIKLFSSYGKVLKLDYLYTKEGPKKGQPRGYCFLEYETIQEASKAIKYLDGKEIKGRSMRVKYASEATSKDRIKVAPARGRKESTMSKIDALEKKLAEMESKPLEVMQLQKVEAKMESIKESIKERSKPTHGTKPYDRPGTRTKPKTDRS